MHRRNQILDYIYTFLRLIIHMLNLSTAQIPRELVQSIKNTKVQIIVQKIKLH